MKALKYFAVIIMLAFINFGGVDLAWAGRRIVVRLAPPAPKVVHVARPACPHKSGVWVAGHWEHKTGKYIWIDGKWIGARKGHVWVDGHWRNTADGWEWMPGHWTRK